MVPYQCAVHDAECVVGSAAGAPADVVANQPAGQTAENGSTRRAACFVTGDRFRPALLLSFVHGVIDRHARNHRCAMGCLCQCRVPMAKSKHSHSQAGQSVGLIRYLRPVVLVIADSARTFV